MASHEEWRDSTGLGRTYSRWWMCTEGPEWQAVIDSRNMGSRCPYRAGNRVISGVNDIVTVFLNLVASSDYENNKGMAPKQMKAKTAQKFG